MSKKKILIMADLPGWCFHNHAMELQSRLADDFDITIKFARGNRSFNPQEYDLIYLMCISSACGNAPKEKTVLGCRAEFVYQKRGGIQWLINKSKQMSKALHVVNKRMFEAAKEKEQTFSVSYVTHGVNLDKFDGQLDNVDGDLIVGWNGCPGSGGRKGWSDLIKPLEEIEGVKVEYRGQKYQGTRPKHTPHGEMVHFYNGIHVYVCASASEGNNNSLLEAAACGRALVSTPVGTVPEYISDGENGFIVDRNAEALKKAIVKLRDDRQLLRKFGDSVRTEIRTNWSWKKKAEDYREWFWKNIDGPRGLSKMDDVSSLTGV